VSVKLALVVVGRVKGPIASVIEEYEQRIRHYFSFDVSEVKEVSSRKGTSPAEVMAAEGERLLAKVPDGFELIALDRKGVEWSSERLARHIELLGVNARPGIALMIGGAFGLAPEVLDRADRLLSLSAMTLPHELARLMITEQIYRAGTIQRGEPYHKGGNS
jgi:23S rRNA (pseudouridine1915-N3)-methyltransferase